MTGAQDRRGSGCRAVIFDFNGTLSDDESVLYEVYAAMFAEHGQPLTRKQYVDLLAGLSDEAILRRWLGDRDDIQALVQDRIRRYRAVADGATIGPPVRRAVRYAAARVPTAIVSGAATVEIDGVLRAAALDDAFSVVVGSDRVSRGKPDPQGYELALAELGALVDDLRGDEVLAFEDTDAGIAAACAAGVRCIAVAGTVPRARLAQAEAIVEAIDEAALWRLLG
jgi:beta-phosphoglucomutase-like phosphatase (HAD superfamily)